MSFNKQPMDVADSGRLCLARTLYISLSVAALLSS